MLSHFSCLRPGFRSIPRMLNGAVPLVAGLLAAALGAPPARAVDAALCRELERKYDLARADITSVQTNSTLFSAAEKGCESLARRLLAEGASVEARDREGTMPLARA